ncbi:MAG: hypothetical protein ACOCRL_01965 [Bacillota bacterium]
MFYINNYPNAYRNLTPIDIEINNSLNQKNKKIVRFANQGLTFNMPWQIIDVHKSDEQISYEFKNNRTLMITPNKSWAFEFFANIKNDELSIDKKNDKSLYIGFKNLEKYIKENNKSDLDLYKEMYKTHPDKLDFLRLPHDILVDLTLLIMKSTDALGMENIYYFDNSTKKGIIQKSDSHYSIHLLNAEETNYIFIDIANFTEDNKPNEDGDPIDFNDVLYILDSIKFTD